jgi:hypothetical protein
LTESATTGGGAASGVGDAPVDPGANDGVDAGEFATAVDVGSGVWVAPATGADPDPKLITLTETNAVNIMNVANMFVSKNMLNKKRIYAVIMSLINSLTHRFTFAKD